MESHAANADPRFVSHFYPPLTMSPTSDPRTAARSQLIRLLAERLVRDALAGEDPQIEKIVNDAIQQHGLAGEA